MLIDKIDQVELLDWKPGDLTPREKESDADEYIVRHVVKKPKNWSALPNDGSTVTGQFDFAE